MVDPTGYEVVACRYGRVSRVHESRVVVSMGPTREEDEWYGGDGVIDLEGREILRCVHESVSDFGNGRAQVTTKLGRGQLRTYWVDREGREAPDSP